MSQRYQRTSRIGWTRHQELWRGRDRETDGEVLLAFLQDRSREAHMRFRDRLRRLARAAPEDLVPVRDSDELAGGVLLLVLEAAGDLPLDFLLAEGVGDVDERARWAATLSQGLAALHAAGLRHGRLAADACLVDAAGRLRLAPPDLVGDDPPEAADRDALERLTEALGAEAGPALEGRFEDLVGRFRALPAPSAPPAPPRTHRRPAPAGDDPDRAGGPGPYRVPLWARAGAVALVAGAALALLRLLGVSGG